MDLQAVFNQLKAFVGFTEEDERCLVSLQPWIEAHGREITDTFYERIAETPDLAPYIGGKLDHLKQTHFEWMRQLVGGDYGPKYFESRWRIGQAHVRIGLDPIWVDCTMALIRNRFILSLATGDLDAHEMARAQACLLKVCDLDLAIINLAYTEDRMERLCEFTGLRRSLLENVIKMAS